MDNLKDQAMQSFELTATQIEQFHHQGFVLLKNALPPELLARWRQLADKMDGKAMAEYKNGVIAKDYCVVEDPGGPRLMRYDDIIQFDIDASLALFACPAMLAVAEKLCGVGCIPLQMDMLFKQSHPHPVINWHQGAQHSREFPYLNIGIYLDDALEDDGCLRYVPGTQHELEDIQGLSEEHGWQLPNVVQQPAQAGDILIQDMMVLHGSEPKRSEGVRRTIYVEYRPFEAVVKSQSQSENWAELRRQLMANVVERAGSLLPQRWHDYYGSALDNIKLEELVKILIESREPPLPAVWATFPVEHPEYPVPSDLRDI